MAPFMPQNMSQVLDALTSFMAEKRQHSLVTNIQGILCGACWTQPGSCVSLGLISSQRAWTTRQGEDRVEKGGAAVTFLLL